MEPERIVARQRVSRIPGLTVREHHIGTGGQRYDAIGPAMAGFVAKACWAGTRPAKPTTARVNETRTKRNA